MPKVYIYVMYIYIYYPILQKCFAKNKFSYLFLFFEERIKILTLAG